MIQSIAQLVIDLACTIQQIPAPTFGEQERSAYIEQRFSKDGLAQVSRDSLGNVYALIPGRSAGPPLIVTAHMDTVFPTEIDLTLTSDSGRISGPGIGDNSLGVAALVSLAWTIKDPPRDIWLVANVCEEGLGNLHGIKEVVNRFGNNIHAYIVLEGMSLGHIYHAGLSVQRYRITVTTPGGHAWVDYGKPSAVHQLAELIVQLNHLPIPIQPRTSLNVGVIRGGTSINTIASEASMELDLRSESNQNLVSLASTVEALVMSAQQKFPPLVHTKVEMIGMRPAGRIEVDHPLVQLAVSCLQEQGITPRFSIGSTDANYPLSQGLPAICVGVTTGGGAHTMGEYINTQPLQQGLNQLHRLVDAACSQLS